MKKLLLLFCLFFTCIAGMYILSERVDPKEEKSKKLFDKRYYSVSELNQINFEKKRERKIREGGSLSHSKFDHPDEYTNYYWAIRMRDSESNPVYPQGYKIDALEKALKNPQYKLQSSLRTNSLDWIERGPSNVPGRTRALVVLPQDPQSNTWVAGAVGGGIWKTNDGGISWQNKTPDLPTLAITWIALCDESPNILYATTGEANGGGRGLIGNGVFKSEDAGESWVHLSSTAGNRAFYFINRIIVNPQNPDIVLLCTSQGEWEREFRSEIYKSDNGGNSWRRVYNSTSWISQIIANPDNFSTIYASAWRKGVLKSVDEGETWTDSSLGFHKLTGRIELAVAKTDSARIYASAQGIVSNTGSDLYVSDDAGNSWSIVEQKYENNFVDFLGGQGDYDNTIAINPYDENEVYFGGVSLWKSSISENSAPIDIPSVSVKVSNGELSQWDLVNFGGEFFDGRLEAGNRLNNHEFLDIELWTGDGLSQKAHRFTVGKKGSGVPDESYIYQDYVEVPFQVWDTNRKIQLMVSFRDQQEDSIFRLISQNTVKGDEENHSREYVFIHDVDYDENPNERIAQSGGKHKGHTFNQLYFFWPVLRDGVIWDPADMPADTIKINYYKIESNKRFGSIRPVSDAYNEFLDLNPAYNDNEDGFGFHPDHHNLVMISRNGDTKEFEILNGNDGGVYISNISDEPGTTNGDWTFSGNGYNSGQFYSATKRPGDDQFIGGLQDNGTWISPSETVAEASTSYITAFGGDGFDVLWHYADPNLILGGSQGNNFYRSEDGGNTWINSTNGLEGDMPFFSKLASSNSHPDRVFTVSSLGVYKSNDFGQTWSLTQINQNWDFSDFMEIKVSKANPDIVWAGSGMSSGRAIHVSVDGGNSFREVTQFKDAELGIVSGFATHPENDSTAYALFSFAQGPKILRTTNLGESWEDISDFGSNKSSSNGFPDVAVYSLLVRPDDPEILWAGTEIGIFESNDNGASWSFLDSGIGSAAVWEMSVVDDQVIFATHGRGIFTATIPLIEEVVIVPKINIAGTSPQGELNVLVELRSSYDSSTLFIDGDRLSEILASEKGEVLLSLEGLTVTGDSINLEFAAYENGRKFMADPFKTILFNVKSPVSTYEQDFETDVTDDFIGYGMEISNPDGFDDFAIHSDHPYLEGNGFPENAVDFVYQLKVPIIVSSKNSLVDFKDIALVEPGEIKALFPSSDFYDYVVVEGSADGVFWQNLGKGYDAAKNGKWVSAYEGNEPIDKALYINESVDIKSVFHPEDTIFIRFRLFSDAFASGWGWSIDDLAIQSVVTGIENQDVLVKNISVYPNPASDKIAISGLKTEDQYKLKLYGVNGEVVIDKTITPYTFGEVYVDISNLIPGIYILRLNSPAEDFTSKLLIK